MSLEITKKAFHLRRGEKGALSFLEGGRDVPFTIRRVYYIYDVAAGERRGFHAHKTLEQYLICVHGSCRILLDNGTEQAEAQLSDPNEGLYIGPGTWREMYDFSDGAVLLVLASDYYTEDDYIRDYQTFLDYVRNEGAG